MHKSTTAMNEDVAAEADLLTMPPKGRRASASTKQRAAETAAGIDPFAQPIGYRNADGTEGVRRDGYGRYLAPSPPTPENPEGGQKDVPYTRATTMAKTISDTFAINKWDGRMIVKGLTLRPDLRALAAATPLEDRDTLNKIAEDAKTAAGNKVSANLGTARHALTELYDRGQPLPPLEPEEDRDLAAYKAVLEEAGITVLGNWIERSVFRLDHGGVAGTLDRIVRMPDGTLRIADLKTGKDLSYGWGEISIQLKIYQGAEWSYDYATGLWERMPETDPNIGLVIHLPVGAGEATLYDVNLKAGQIGLELAHQVRGWRKSKNLAVPRQTARAASAASTPDAVTVAPATPLQRVQAATNKATLAALWDELNPLGQWTPELMAAAQAQMSKFATT